MDEKAAELKYESLELEEIIGFLAGWLTLFKIPVVLYVGRILKQNWAH